MKCSVPLGRLRMAFRLMISVQTDEMSGYCWASSLR